MKNKKIILLLLMCVAILFSACTNSQMPEASTTTTEIQTISTTKGSSTTTEKLTTTTTSEVKKESTTSTTSTTKASTTKKQKVEATTKSTTVKTTKKQTTTSTTKAKDYCILTIECKAILSNIDDLAIGHEEYIPDNGYILNNYKVEYANGDTAYDILRKGCNEKGIKLTEKSSIYGVYIVGINNIDEKDCGQYSGWKYKVNSTFPGVACSEQSVNANDTITFTYVCTY